MKHFIFAAPIIWGCEAFLRNSGLKNWNNPSLTLFLDINNLQLLPRYNLTHLFETKDQFVRLNHKGNRVNRRKNVKPGI